MFRSIAIVAIGTLLASCGSPLGKSKLSAEEQGYILVLEDVLAATCRVGTTEQVQVGMVPITTQCGVTSFGTPQMCTRYQPVYESKEIGSLSEAGIDISQARNDLAFILPPAELRLTHANLVAAIDANRSDPSAAQSACSQLKDFHDRANQREQVIQTNESLYLVFEPIVGPSVSLDTRNGFTVEPNFSVPTKLGSLSAGYKSSEGVKILKIVSEDQQRVFVLDRPFEFVVPEEYSVRVSYAGGDELLLYVEK
ncbi:hypothetical protein AAG592_00490 [Citromicrobium bathyomarinum]|uniref:hypothetical protein n=1 Tax=Citromicrobium bathyomarinum TaxID=72174 RepID=UPI003159EC25